MPLKTRVDSEFLWTQTWYFLRNRSEQQFRKRSEGHFVESINFYIKKYQIGIFGFRSWCFSWLGEFCGGVGGMQACMPYRHWRSDVILTNYLKYFWFYWGRFFDFDDRVNVSKLLNICMNIFSYQKDGLQKDAIINGKLYPYIKNQRMWISYHFFIRS